MVWILRFFLLISFIEIFWIIINKKIAGKIRKEFSYTDIRSNEGLLLKIKNHKIKYAILIFLVFSLSAMNGNSIAKGIFLAIFTCLFLMGYSFMRRNSEKKSVLQDLLNVTECLRVQISSGISLDTALRNISNLCRNKTFQTKLTDLYLEYELSKFTVSSSARNLQDRFDYPEIRIFISALNQQCQNTTALEAFDNLIEVLKEKYIEYMEENTKEKSLIMVFGVLIIVFNLAAMGVYPLIVETMEALKIMFI